MIIYSQGSYDKESYLDSLSNETDFEKAVYTRIVKNYGALQNEYLFTDYYKSGKQKMVGKSTSRDFLSKKGPFVNYYENGLKKELINYNESLPIGNYYSWYDSGEKKIVGEYLINQVEFSEPRVLRIDQFWDGNCNQKVIEGNGYYIEEVDDTTSRGKLVGGLKDSIWVGSENKIKLSFKEEYKNGSLILGTSIDSMGNSYIYEKLNIKPIPKGGIESFYRFIGKNFIVPETVPYPNGKVFLSFVIEKNGSIGEVKVLRGIHPLIDYEAVRILFKCPAWEPGKLRGMVRRVLYSLPITISGP